MVIAVVLHNIIAILFPASISIEGTVCMILDHKNHSGTLISTSASAYKGFPEERRHCGLTSVKTSNISS